MLSGVRLLPSSHMVEGLIIELVFYDKTMKLSLSLFFSLCCTIFITLCSIFAVIVKTKL